GRVRSPRGGAGDSPSCIAAESLKHSRGSPFDYPSPRLRPRASLMTLPPGQAQKNAGRQDPPRAFTVIRRFNRRTGYTRTSSQRQDRDVVDDAGIDDLPAGRQGEVGMYRPEGSALVRQVAVS